MAREFWNDEDEVDGRLPLLAEAVQDRDRARGMLIRFWRWARELWSKGERGIPLAAFKAARLDPLVDLGYAVIQDNVVYIDDLQRFSPLKKGKGATPVKEQRRVQWDATDPLDKIFKNLLLFPKYAEVFDVEKDRDLVQGHMDRHRISAKEMEQITWELKNWALGPAGEKCKSPRGTLSTFVRNFLARRPVGSQKSTPTFTEADLDKLIS